MERGVCAWLAILSRLVWGGVPYHGHVISRAASSKAELAERIDETRRQPAQVET
jgi:hypothetical protein